MIAAWLSVLMLSSGSQLLQLDPGQTELIEVGVMTDIIIGNPELIDVQVVDQEFLAVAALAPGQTEVRLITADKRQQTINITIRKPVNHKRALTLAYIAELYPQLQQTEQNQFTVLKGRLTHSEKQQVESIVGDYADILLQFTPTIIPPSPMIELSVRIFEVKRSYTQHIGVRWPQQIAGPLLSSTAAQALRFPVDVSTSLELLVRDGHARLLAEPTLSTYSGGEAEFLVGGEFPIPQVLAQGVQDVTFRDYGIVLKIAPQLSENNSVKTTLSAEISSIDPALAVNGIPGILSRRVSSMVEVKLGESLALSGLISHEQSVQADHFPGLHQIPVLGALFSSKQFRNAETELLMVVTPRLASTRADQQQQQVQAHKSIAEYRKVIGCMGLMDGQG